MDKRTDLYRNFLCACIRGDSAVVQTALDRKSWNWESLFQAASDEAILPLLRSQFQSLDLFRELPAEIADFLLEVETANRERNQAIVAELKVAVTLLNKIGIEPVLLKGLAYLTTGVYRDPAHRFLMDIDLLVAEEQWQSAAEVLTQNGWIAHTGDPFRKFRQHGPALRRPSSALIEIHHNVGVGACERVLPARDVIERSIPTNLEGLRVRVPCREDLLVHLILHSQMLHPYNQRIWPPVRAMLDLFLINRHCGPNFNWVPVAERFLAAGNYGVFALHLLQVQDSLNLTLPLPIRRNPFLRFCWYRRKTLQRYPNLRYADPFYMTSMAFSHRLRMLRKVLATRSGARYMLAQMFAPKNYLRLWTDLVQGRGR